MSIKSFFDPPQKFSNDEKATTPYEDAENAWDNRDGHVRLQNFNLRRMNYGLIIICIILAGGIIFQSTKSSVAPYIIEVDSTTGMAKNVGMVESQKYSPKEAEIKYFLSDFLKNIRSIPLDPIVFSSNWDKAYAYMTRNATSKINALMAEEEPTKLIGRKTVQIKIVVMVPVSENSYQVRWTEESVDIVGGAKTITPMSGIFTIHLETPKDKNIIDVNPLGIYISDFNWAKEAPTQQENKIKK